MHPTRLPPRSLALRPGLGTDGGCCCLLPPFCFSFLLLFRFFVTTHTPPRFPWAVCRCCMLFFILCGHLFLSVPVIFPGLIFLSCLLLFRGPRFNFFKFVLFNSRDCTSGVRSPGHLCLALGASGYLGARQSRGPPGRGVAERAARVPANYA